MRKVTQFIFFPIHDWLVEQLKKKFCICFPIMMKLMTLLINKIAVDIDFITFGFVFCFNSKLLRPRHCLGGRICYVVTGRVMASRVVESQTLPRSSKVLR